MIWTWFHLFIKDDGLRILPGMYNHIVIAVHFQKSTVCVCVCPPTPHTHTHWENDFLNWILNNYRIIHRASHFGTKPSGSWWNFQTRCPPKIRPWMRQILTAWWKAPGVGERCLGRFGWQPEAVAFLLFWESLKTVYHKDSHLKICLGMFWKVNHVFFLQKRCNAHFNVRLLRWGKRSKRSWNTLKRSRKSFK